MFVKEYRLPGAETHKHAQKIVEFAENHAKTTHLEIDEFKEIINEVKKLKSQLQKARPKEEIGYNHTKEEPDHIILAQKALDYVVREGRKEGGKIHLEDFYITRQHINQKKAALDLIQNRVIPKYENQCFSALEQAIKDIHKEVLQGVDEVRIDKLLDMLELFERAKRKYQGKATPGNAQNAQQKESAFQEYQNEWAKYTEIAEDIKKSVKNQQFDLSEPLRSVLLLIKRVKEDRSDALKHHAMTHFFDKVFIKQFLQAHESLSKRADVIRNEFRAKGITSEHEIEQYMSIWRQNQLLEWHTNSTLQHIDETSQTRAEQVIDSITEDVRNANINITESISNVHANITEGISKIDTSIAAGVSNVNANIAEGINNINTSITEGVQIINRHHDKMMRQAVQEMIDSLNDFGRLLEEKQSAAELAQFRASYTMLQDAVKKIASNTEHTVLKQLLPSLEAGVQKTLEAGKQQNLITYPSMTNQQRATTPPVRQGRDPVDTAYRGASIASSMAKVASSGFSLGNTIVACLNSF